MSYAKPKNILILGRRGNTGRQRWIDPPVGFVATGAYCRAITALRYTQVTKAMMAPSEP